MVKKSKAIIEKEEFNAEMRSLLMWFVRSDAPVVFLGLIGVLLTAVFAGEKTAIIAAIGAITYAIPRHLSNYIQYRQQQVPK